MSIVLDDLKALQVLNDETTRLYQKALDREKKNTRLACVMAEHMLDYLIAEDEVTVKVAMQYKLKLQELLS